MKRTHEKTKGNRAVLVTPPEKLLKSTSSPDQRDRLIPKNIFPDESNDFPADIRESQSDSHSADPNSKRCLFTEPTDDDDQALTQEADYSQDPNAGLDFAPPKGRLFDIFKEGGSSEITIWEKDPADEKKYFIIGRCTTCDYSVDSQLVSRKHCSVQLEGEDFVLHAYSTCWIKRKEWVPVPPTRKVPLLDGSHFRLTPASKRQEISQVPGSEFRLELGKDRRMGTPGSNSFDVQYLSLLQQIEMEGVARSNKKGSNHTLQKSFVLSIELDDDGDRNLLPLTSLRSLYGGRAALIEALWYLRGEDHIEFLQANKCHFWDKQAADEIWVGLNYGLLTRFPGDSVDGYCNQLEENVLKPLQAGKSSRNMTCSLENPCEPTLQKACTSSIQFSVRKGKNGREYLDLTVTQRSSDVILGLPYDVVVWSIILHLVRREVRRRSQRHLWPGRLIFSINSGGAHVYDINRIALKELLQRKPISLEDPPELIIDGNGIGMFEIAQSYGAAFASSNLRIQNYTKTHPRIKLEQAVENSAGTWTSAG